MHPSRHGLLPGAGHGHRYSIFHSNIPKCFTEWIAVVC